MIKNYLSFLMLILSSSIVFGQATLSYDKGTGVNGGTTASVSYPELSTCQSAVSVVGNSGIWNGVVWSNGTFNVIVNGTTIGNYPTGTNVNLNAYLPITSLQLTSNAGTWHTVGGVVTLTSTAAFGAPTVANVNYAVGATASPLTATLTGGATSLKWYTTATGAGYTATAPTPSTASAGITSYWVSQANGSGCEGARALVKVYVGTEENQYHAGTGVIGGQTASVTVGDFSTCQTEAFVVCGSGVWDGVSWSNGTYNLTVNGTSIGSYAGGTQVDLTAYIPITSVNATSSAWTWHTVDATVHIVSMASSTPDAPTVSNVYYTPGQTASALTATLSGTGTTLKWYTSAIGDGYSATAPTPSTAAVGTTSYWVAQADASGCESQRSEIKVIVANLGTHLDFDGTNDEVLVPAETINNLPSATIETWVNVGAFGSTDQSIFTKQSNFENTYVSLLVKANGQVYYKSKNNSGEIYSNTTLTAGQWYHIAVAFDGGDADLYINGVLDASAAGDFSIPDDITITGASFGSIYTNANWNLTGSIDEFRVWNTYLDEASINRRMSCEIDPATSGLMAYYTFNHGYDAVENPTATTLEDQTTYAHDGTLNNFGLTAATSNWIDGSPITSGVIIPEMPTGTQAFTYCYNETASQLAATGTGLMWFTSQVGGTGDANAPTPSTTTAGTTSYWVASTNANGCESERMEVQVAILPQASGTDVQQACDSYQWIDGNTYTSSNNAATYTIANGAANGCDSIVTLDLTINGSPTATNTDNGNGTFTASGNGSYQWVDCANANAPIAGATNALFAPSVNGNYAVVVSANGCSTTSNCIAINSLALNELTGTATITVVPNPGTDLVNIVSSTPVDQAIVYSANGTYLEQTSTSTLNVQSYAPGVYFIHVITTTGKQVVRFVKQ
jgi:hypothetical protein